REEVRRSVVVCVRKHRRESGSDVTTRTAGQLHGPVVGSVEGEQVLPRPAGPAVAHAVQHTRAFTGAEVYSPEIVVSATEHLAPRIGRLSSFDGVAPAFQELSRFVQGRTRAHHGAC